jgi:D-alanyl-D-alanine carboxypeptidase
MNHITSTLLILLMLSAQNCAPSLQAPAVATCPTVEEKSSQTMPQHEALQKVLNDIVKEGVPGCAMAVYSPEGWFTGAAGFARLEDQTPMQPCHLQYLQSISKTYMAVAILKLYEEGRIDLDAPLTQYLPAQQAQAVTNGAKITIRMLLAHRSGIPEYNMRPAYITKLLQHPEYIFEPVEYFQYIDGRPLDFEPGSKFIYCNTNYEILALIADAITGNHAQFISETIFKPLELTHTHYRHEPNYMNYSNLVNTYWDRYSDGVIENATVLQHNNVISLIGDDGIVATPEDVVKFLRGLMEGKLLKPATLALMQTWSADRQGNPTYGLGLDYALFKGKVAYGHSGGGIGAGCQLYYFPEKKLYFFVGINLGTVTESPIHKRLETHLGAMQEALLR